MSKHIKDSYSRVRHVRDEIHVHRGSGSPVKGTGGAAADVLKNAEFGAGRRDGRAVQRQGLGSHSQALLSLPESNLVRQRFAVGELDERQPTFVFRVFWVASSNGVKRHSKNLPTWLKPVAAVPEETSDADTPTGPRGPRRKCQWVSSFLFNKSESSRAFHTSCV